MRVWQKQDGKESGMRAFGWVMAGLGLGLVTSGGSWAAGSAGTLAQALDHWTGMTSTVRLEGGQATIGLPATSPVSEVLAAAHPGQHGDEAGWALSDARVPAPARLRDGSMLAITQQTGEAWLGARSATLSAEDAGLALTDPRGRTLRVAHAHVHALSQGQDVTVTAVLDGISGTVGGIPLLPNAARLDGATTPAGAAALSALMAGRGGPVTVPITLHDAVLEMGPSEIAAHGAVTLHGDNDRDGTLVVTATHFDALMQSLPQTGPAVKALPVLLVLRQFAQKDASGRLRWTVTFQGSHVLVDGVDLAALSRL